MQHAAFSLEKYQFDKVVIELENHSKKDLNLHFGTKGIFYNKDNSFELIFTVDVKKSNKVEPFVSIRCKGRFLFENVTKVEDVPDFFYRNSIAILFPYVRAYLSLVTTQANVPGIMLPTLNLSGLEIELKKNTIQK